MNFFIKNFVVIFGMKINYESIVVCRFYNSICRCIKNHIQNRVSLNYKIVAATNILSRTNYKTPSSSDLSYML